MEGRRGDEEEKGGERGGGGARGGRGATNHALCDESRDYRITCTYSNGTFLK